MIQLKVRHIILVALVPILMYMKVCYDKQEPIPHNVLFNSTIPTWEPREAFTSNKLSLKAKESKVVKPSKSQSMFKYLAKGLIHKNSLWKVPDEPTDRDLQPILPHPPKVWVSMSVCVSGNTKYFKKENFPYVAATQMAVQLWHEVANLSTIVQVVYDKDRQNTTKVEEFSTYLRNLGSVVYPMENNGNLDCSLKAQMQRIFVSHIPEIEDDDLVVTSDVDIFPMVPNILDDLKRDYKIWLFQYAVSEMKHHTFSMSFIAMTKALWKQLLLTATPEDTIQRFLPSLVDQKTTWNYDQLIVSTVILKSGVCSLDSKNPLWKTLGLEPADPEPSDVQTCYHGYHWWDCNKARPRISSGCMMWHFHPDERIRDLSRIFKSILKSSKQP